MLEEGHATCVRNETCEYLDNPCKDFKCGKDEICKVWAGKPVCVTKNKHKSGKCPVFTPKYCTLGDFLEVGEERFCRDNDNACDGTDKCHQ